MISIDLVVDVISRSAKKDASNTGFLWIEKAEVWALSNEVEGVTKLVVK